MLDDIQTALGRVLSAADNWDVSYSQLGSWQTDDGSALDTGRVLPNGQRSIVELDAVFLAIRGFASTLSEATAQDINLVPDKYLREFGEASERLEVSVGNLAANQAAISASGRILEIDPNNFVVRAEDGGAIQLGPLFLRVSKALEGFLSNYYRLTNIVAGSPGADFGPLVGSISASRNELLSLVRAIRRYEADSKKIFESAEQLLGTAQDEIESRRKVANDLLGQTDAHNEEIQSAKEQAERVQNDSNEIIGRVTEILGRANELGKSINENSAKFSEFEGQIDDRNVKYEETQTNYEKLMSDLRELEESVTDLKKSGEKMLSLTTAAGVASSFRDASIKLDRPLAAARRTFYLSLAVLFLLVGLAVGIELVPQFPGFALPEGGSFGSNFVQLVISSSVRLLIVLPGVIFVGFSQRRHRSLFLLRENYQHKFTVASSVPGFELVAPEHAQAMAAAAFDELLKNPTSHMDRERRGRKDGPLARPLRRAWRKLTPDRLMSGDEG